MQGISHLNLKGMKRDTNKQQQLPQHSNNNNCNKH